VSATDPGRLALQGALTVDRVAAVHRALQGQLEGIERIDLSAVTEVDSAGVALVQSLRRSVQARSGRWPALTGLPPRFSQLCVAHRVGLDGN
jgi:phospholipid transport system transporter-binding protein